MFALHVDDDLVLGLLEERRAEELYALVDANRAYLGRFLPWVDQHTSAEHARGFIARCRHEIATGTAVHVGVFHRGALVGHASLMDIRAGHRAEIGYWLAEDVGHRGLMTRCVRALIGHAFGELGLRRLVIRCRTDNRRSSNIARRLGFQYEGLERSGERHSERLFDVECYSLLSEDPAPSR